MSGPDTLVRDILGGLAEGRFVPGQRLSEPDLMQLYGVSRSTVREGLGRLSAAGVIVQARHRGAQIRHLQADEVRDVVRVMAVLLGLAARQASEAVALGADPGTFAAAALAYEAAPPGQASRARTAYYRALLALAGNAELHRLLPMVQVHLILAQMQGAGGGAGRDVAVRRKAMVQAIIGGMPGPAEDAARAHVEGLTRIVGLAEGGAGVA